MKNVIFIVLIFLFVQCTNKNDTVGYYFDVCQDLYLEEIKYPEILGDPMQMLKKDSILFINDYFGDSLIHMYNLNSHKVERKLVSKGNVPNELIPPLEIQYQNNKLWILSRPLHLLYNISLNEMSPLNSLSKNGVVKSESDCFVVLPDNKIVFSGFWDNRYAFGEISNLQSVKEFGEYPNFWNEESSIPQHVKAMFHQCRFAVNKKRQKLVSCSYFVLEIFDIKGDVMPELAFRKQLGRYTYDYIATEQIRTKMRTGCDPVTIDVVATDEYLYLLMQDSDNKKNRNIAVIDWSGEPVKLLKSGKRILCFTIDEKERKGYCAVEDGEIKLMSFDLDEWE